MSAVRNAARRLAARGIPTFPCVRDGKRPLTPHGFVDASADPSVIDHWFRCWPRANLAVPTGLRSGFVVIDVDTKRTDGFATLDALEREIGPLPATLATRTPSGGEHRWFRAPPIVIRSAAGRIARDDAAGVDVRGEGGYVLVPPSAIDTNAYAWVRRAPLGELPPGWVEALSQSPRSAAPEAEPQRVQRGGGDHTRAWCMRALRDEARELAGAAPGTRNDRLWRSAAALAGLVGERMLDADDVRRALRWACATWPERDARKDVDTLERGIAFGLALPRRVDLRGSGAA